MQYKYQCIKELCVGRSKLASVPYWPYKMVPGDHSAILAI